MSTQTEYTELEAYLEVDGTRIQIASFTLNFALNNIPTATCVAVSIDDKDIPKLQHGFDAELILTTIDINKTRDTQLVFEGITSGFSPIRNRDKITYVITLVHWLYRLTYTSLHSHLFSSRTALNPIQPFTFTAWSPFDGNNSSIEMAANELPDPQGNLWRTIVTAAEIGANNAALTREADDVLVAARVTEPRELDGVGDNKAGEVMITLNRIQGKLPFTVDESVPEFVVDWIKRTIADTFLNNANSQMSTWDAIRQMAATFDFVIAPMIRTAHAVPVIPNLKSDLFDPYMQLLPSEYDALSVQNLSNTPIRGVVVLGAKDKSAWCVFSDKQQLVWDWPVGVFTPKHSGPIHTVIAPPWLRYATRDEERDSVSSQARCATCGSDIEEPDIPDRTKDLDDTVNNPDPKKLGKDGNNPALNPRSDVKIVYGDTPKLVVVMPPDTISKAYVGAAKKPPAVNAARSADKYAKMVYSNLVLAGRQVSVRGKLRLDIGPGASVAVVIPGGHKAGFGIVGAVTVTVDRMRTVAETTFHLFSYRTYQEDRENATMFDQHPFYKEVFLGTSLDELPGVSLALLYNGPGVAATIA